MRVVTKVVAGLGLVALLATACASEEESASDACQKDPFGCATYGTGEPIKLGAALSISGNTAFLGNDSVNGIKLAIDNLDGTLDGKNGQLLGRDVTIQSEDTLCTKEGGQSAGTKIAADAKIVATIGTTCSSEALGVADKILSDKGILLISPSNTNPNLTAEGTHQPFYARTAHNDKIQGAIVADFVVQVLKAKTAATINDESPYADALAAVFRQNFEAQGGKTTAKEAVQSTDTDFKPLLTRIAQDKPNVLYFPDFNPACGLIAKQAKGITGLASTTLIGSDGCLDPSYLTTAGSAADGTFASGPDFSGLETTNAFYRDQFLPAYKKLTGGKPTAAFHAHAYDAASMVFNAIKKVAIQEGGSIFVPRTKLKDEVFATSGYQGITGTITCDDTGDCAGSVTIGVYKAPNWPVEGGKGDGKSVFAETKTLADVS